MTFIGEDLKDKCVVVTGATGGIGSAVAHAFAEPKEISQAVVFSASSGSSHITGAFINISGGQLMS